MFLKLKSHSWSGFRSLSGPALQGSFVIAFLIRTRDYRSVFADSLHQVLMPAIGALLGNGLGRRSELAVWIVPASVKSVALARPFFDEFAFFAFRTLHADEVLLDILAVGIATAGSELAVAAVTQNQVALAQRAGFIERDVGHFLALIEPPRRLAIGIAGAGHELAEAPALQHHHTAAVFAIFFLRSLLDVGRVEIGQIDGI